MLVGCATTTPAPQNTPKPPEAEPAPRAEPSAPAATPEEKPQNVAVSALQLDAERVVRLRGVVARIVGMRLVPAKLIFELRDQTGTVRAVINEKAQLREGGRIELVGRYRNIPSPMHSGPGEAPSEPVFVVDRFIAF